MPSRPKCSDNNRLAHRQAPLENRDEPGAPDGQQDRDSNPTYRRHLIGNCRRLAGRERQGRAVGAPEVAVEGGGVAVMMTVITWGGCVGMGVGEEAVPQPTIAVSIAQAINKSARFFIAFLS